VPDLSGCLLIRADATAEIGTGHIMRCLALAQAWKDAGGEAIFVCSPLPGTLERCLLQEGFESVLQFGAPGSEDDASEISRLASRFDPDWIVCDGYSFGTNYQRRMRRTGARLLVVDDYAHLSEYDADVILNPNLGAERSNYHVRKGAPEFLLGSRFALLRREFRDVIPDDHPPRERDFRLIVTMGGADEGNASEIVLANLRQAGGAERLAEIEVLVGPANRWRNKIGAACEAFSIATGIRTVPLFQPPSLPELFRDSDLAISAAGGTCWELAYLGVPMILLSAAENQRPVALNIQKAGFGIDVGEPAADMPGLVRAFDTLVFSPALREKMSRTARQHVDAQGPFRVCEVLERLRIRLRAAESGDARFLFELANDTEVRRQSFSSTPISWDDHQAWLARRLADPDSRIYIALEGVTPVGQVRFDNAGPGQAELSYSVTPERRGAGLATVILRRGARRAFRDMNVDLVIARVKSQNEASCRALEASGFQPSRGDTSVQTKRYTLLKFDS
jgi:UDP-2,4-diacetamido-2,4,6-trideoxy-beta-L-altropyranose hydrolase